MKPATPNPRNDSVMVEIGGMAIGLRTQDPVFRNLLEARYAGFIGKSGRPDFDFDIDLYESGYAPDEDVQVRMEGDAWVLTRGDFRGCWVPGSRHGHVRQANSPYAIDSVLRIVHSLLLARQGGFLLHAASTIRDGRAFLFAGVSGAGKTTIARLAPADCTLLTDEISYVRRDQETYFACGTPFSGELGKPGENRSAPLRTLFFLEKGSDNRIETVSAGDAVRLLLRNILFFADDGELVRRVFQSACEFVERVQVRKLVFMPHAAVWEIIR